MPVPYQKHGRRHAVNGEDPIPGLVDVIGGGSPFLMSVMLDATGINTTSTSYTTVGGGSSSRTSSDWAATAALGLTLEVRFIAWLQSGTAGKTTTAAIRIEAMNIGDTVASLTGTSEFCEISTTNAAQTLCDSGWTAMPALSQRDNLAAETGWRLKTEIGTSVAQIYRPQLHGRWI